MTGNIQVEETSAYCTVNHRASASNYHLSNMKRPARDSNHTTEPPEVRQRDLDLPGTSSDDFQYKESDYQINR